MKTKSIKEQLKELRRVQPDPSKKLEFAVLLGAQTAHRQIPAGNFLVARLRSAPALASLLILILGVAGTGMAFASQNALPGDSLYSVKLTVEKARLAATADTNKKTELRMEFAARRLDEVEKIVIRKTNVKASEVNKALESYEKTLDEAEEALHNENIEKRDEAVSVVEKSANDYEQNIARVISRVEEHDGDDKIKERLERAREHTKEKIKTRGERPKKETEIESETSNGETGSALPTEDVRITATSTKREPDRSESDRKHKPETKDERADGADKRRQESDD